jgi:ubiquinol-cytochrome c reductase cytochrome c subunit
MRYFITLLGLVLFVSAAAAQNPARAPAKTSAPAGNVENGKKLFSSDGCYQCHGYQAQGGVGPRLAPRPISFATFSKYLRQPTGEMPPYTIKVLPEKELADLYSFLVSIPEPAPVQSIPLLNKQ